MSLEDGQLKGVDERREAEKKKLMNGDVIYIYRGSRSRNVYIGQTRRFFDRHKQHYSGREEAFEHGDFDEVKVLYSSFFNGSALDHVENMLITYFAADAPPQKRRATAVTFHQNDLLNRNQGNRFNAYREEEEVATQVILPFWEALHSEGWVHTPSLEELRNQALVKYSPIKRMTEQQNQYIDEIIDRKEESFVIHGDAGTGKTVLLTHLVAKLLNEKPEKKIAVVTQPNWISTAKHIFKIYGMNTRNLTIDTSTNLIHAGQEYDVIIVDEAHKLSRHYSKQLPSFNRVYVGRFQGVTHHLDCLKQLGRQMVLMYDVLQAIRPANITRSQFKIATAGFLRRDLSTQFRRQAPKGKTYTSDDFINGIKYLLYKDTRLLEETNFDPDFNRDVFKDNDEDAYFGYFDSEPLKNLSAWIEEDRQFNSTHINRILGGLVEPWKHEDGKHPSITHWHEGTIKRRWNKTQENWLQSKEDDAEDQIGSVFAVQGIDLNKVGVLIGNDLQVDREGRLFGNPEHFHNVNGKFPKKGQIAGA